MHWLDLFSQFDITIHHVPGNSHVVSDAFSYCLDLGVVVGPVDSGLFTRICEA